jgi:hypothetical protein
MHYFGISLLILGIVTTVFNFMTMIQIKKHCSNAGIKEINKMNIGVGILIILVAGIMLFNDSGLIHGFAFG